MVDIQKYQACFDDIHAPEAIATEVLNHMKNDNGNRKFLWKWPTTTIAALILLLALSATAFALSTSVFGWANNAEFRGSGTQEAEVFMDIDSLTSPVALEGDRLFFIVNAEHMDITDSFSETQAFLYAYEDTDGITHHWIVGRNGPDIADLGFAEFLSGPDGWLGGYSSNTPIEPYSATPAWFQAGKAALNIPW